MRPCKHTGEAVHPKATITTIPAISFCTGTAFDGCIVESIPLLQELIDVKASDRLELQDTLLGEYMRDDFALTRVVGTVPGVEQTSVNGYEGVIKYRFERAISVGVDDLQGAWISD